jgi:hypothetical protein
MNSKYMLSIKNTGIAECLDVWRERKEESQITFRLPSGAVY